MLKGILDHSPEMRKNIKEKIRNKSKFKYFNHREMHHGKVHSQHNHHHHKYTDH